MSTNDFRDTLAKYAVYLGKRSNYKRKSALLRQLKQDFGMHGYSVKGITDKARFSKAINIHIGNIDEAKLLVIAHYDQPNRVFFSKGEYDPFMETKHLLPQFISENIVQAAVLLTAVAAVSLISEVASIETTLLALILFSLLLIYVFVRFPKGLKNKNNFNKNNSSLLAILAYAKKYPGKNDIAFVLTDFECRNHYGDAMLERMLGDKLMHMVVIHLDSIGKGTMLQVACKDSNETLAAKTVAAYWGPAKPFTRVLESGTAHRTSLRFYPKAVSVSVGELKKDGFVIIGPQTPKDTDIDETLVRSVAELFEKLRNQ
jgi:hypothetical protein